MSPNGLLHLFLEQWIKLDVYCLLQPVISIDIDAFATLSLYPSEFLPRNTGFIGCHKMCFGHILRHTVWIKISNSRNYLDICWHSYCCTTSNIIFLCSLFIHNFSARQRNCTACTNVSRHGHLWRKSFWQDLPEIVNHA